MITIFTEEENVSQTVKPSESPRPFNILGLALLLATIAVVVWIVLK